MQLPTKWTTLFATCAVFGGTAIAVWHAHAREECCATRPPPQAPSSSAQPANAAEAPAAALAPWVSVDPSFNGCAKSCGAGAGAKRDDARPQPGAALGDHTYCPVSGALFKVTDATPKRMVGGKLYYFCCDVCATYFSSHAEERSEEHTSE